MEVQPDCIPDVYGNTCFLQWYFVFLYPFNTDLNQHSNYFILKSASIDYPVVYGCRVLGVAASMVYCRCWYATKFSYS